LRDNAQNERQQLSGEYQLAHVKLGERLDGQTLAGAQLPHEYGITALLVTRPVDEYKTKDFEPSADFALAQRDTLVVVGRRENINRFEQNCGVRTKL
jgi:Trk K+ transport system NAD-binding subunit